MQPYHRFDMRYDILFGYITIAHEEGSGLGRDFRVCCIVDPLRSGCGSHDSLMRRHSKTKSGSVSKVKYRAGLPKHAEAT